MASRDRPIGVTVLSFIAFAAAPANLVVLGSLFFTILTKDVLPSVKQDLVEFVSFWAILGSLAASLLGLAWISFRAGLDLWKLKNRGRRLASVSMVLFLLLGVVYLLVQDTWFTWAGIAVCTVSVSFFVYLQLPSTRRRFETLPRNGPS